MIQTSLLIAAPMLQDTLVDDQTGLPLANGVISLYQDTSRTTFKNWFYQSGSPGAYTYITLPNPLTLSAAGTITDNNGNDTIPFYYPFDEVTGAPQPYYITVQDQFGASKFVRQNFPFVTQENIPSNETVTFKNYLINGEFWRNIGSFAASSSNPLPNTFSFNGSTYYYITLSPSQHDGFSMPDMIFVKDTNDATDTLTFNQFTKGSTSLLNNSNGVTPEFYFNMNCTGVGTETVKYVQFPLQLHLQNFNGLQAQFVFWAQDINNVNSTITVTLLKYLGTGITSPVLPASASIILNNQWNRYAINIPMPSISGVTTSITNDDAWYIQIGYPVKSSCQINVALPKFYLSDVAPSNDFDSYDEINSIISDPRTGDVRVSVNSFVPYGWVPANDGTIGDAKSNATTRANGDTFQLFNLLWNIAKPYDAGSGGHSNPICQMYTSGGSAADFGSTAYADFNANNMLALTRMFGRVILGTAPISVLLPTPLPTQKDTFLATNGAPALIITTTVAVNYFNGMPISFAAGTSGVLPTGLIANAVYYVSNFNGTSAFNITDLFIDAIKGTNLVAWTDAGTPPNNVISAVVGSSEGEYAHTQLIAELATHNHGIVGAQNTAGAPFYPTLLGSNKGQTAPSDAIQNTGSSTPFNVTQPGTFYNIFFKL